MPQTKEYLPEVIVFAGPNGSGKTTITSMAKTIGIYINADEIKATTHCSDMEAAKAAEKMRENAILEKSDFTFETVLSTDRNLKLLKKAKDTGYFIRCIYILTEDPEINKIRILSRKAQGGHDVPPEKIVSRYHKALALIPALIEICDVIHIYDNSVEPFRIYKKRKYEHFYWENEFWDKKRIEELIGNPL